LLLIAILIGEQVHMATIVGLFLIILGVAIQRGMLRRLIYWHRWDENPVGAAGGRDGGPAARMPSWSSALPAIAAMGGWSPRRS